MTVLRILQQSLFALAVAFASASSADTIATFDTLGPNNAFAIDGGWGVGGGSQGGIATSNFAPVMKFTAEVAGTLSSAELVLWQTSCCLGASPLVTLRILADEGGAPGQVLDTTGSSASGVAQVISGTFAGGYQITSGTTYWFGVATDDANASLTWSQNALGVIGTMAFTGASWQQPGEWFYNQGYPLGAFRVNVASPVDEPATALLLVLGAIPLALRLRSRN